MMLGHALVAFAAVSGAASRRVDARQALVVGTVAAAFAAVPDVDILFALPGLAAGAAEVLAAVGSGDIALADVFTVTGSFWDASTEVHRSVTHSLVVAAPAALAAGLLASRDRLDRRLALVGAAVLLLVPVALAYAATGTLDAAMIAALAVGVAAIALAVRRRTRLEGRTVAVVAAVGLASHPFGDLFTGEPPRLLYPLGLDPIPTRVALAVDPTLHLLGTFALEIGAAWAALVVGLALYGRSPRSLLRPVAAVGAAYGLAGLVLAPPTLDASYQFVFSVLAVGLVAAAVAWRGGQPARSVSAQPDGGRSEGAGGAGTDTPSGSRDRSWAPGPGRRITAARERGVAAVVTGTAAVTLAWCSYLTVYLTGLAPA